MTRLPLENRNVHGFDGPEYQLSRLCAHPLCLERAHERHHVWRRSEIGNHNWVVLPDGTAVGNVLMLCHEHHRQITENKAQVSFERDSFWWVEDGHELLPLSFQPPWVIHELEHIRPEDEPPRAQAGFYDPEAELVTEPAFENPGTKTRPVLENECPTCRRAYPKPKMEGEPEKKRERRTWSITVPKDEREDGAQNLDEKLELARELLDKIGLSYGPERRNRYWVTDQVFGLFCTHFYELVSDGES